MEIEFLTDDLPQKLVDLLKEKGLKVATAESLTGGLVSERITSVAGVSEVFECGVCSYSNRIKHEVLGVPSEVLEKYTEYSAETAVEMAKGIRCISGADIGISTTGMAGPTENNTFAKELHLSEGLPDEREKIRFLSSSYALYYALKEIEN